MSEAEKKKIDQAYREGRRAVAANLLQMAVRELGLRSSYGRAAATASELERVRAALREVCEEHGDNEWSDDLDLEDVIQKHLQPYLEQRRGEYDARA